MAVKKKKAASFKERAEKVFATIQSATFHPGFHHMDLWADVGNLALNRLISNNYERGALYGRVFLLYGESGSGKSLLAAGTLGNEQKSKKALGLWFDSEGATDDDVGKEWLTRAGVDLEELLYARVITFEDVFKAMVQIVRQYRQDEKDGLPLQPLIVVIDSLSNLMTTTQYTDSTKKADWKGDQGQHARQSGELIKRINGITVGLPILTIPILHVYQSQDPYGDAFKPSGGNKIVYLASSSLMLTKAPLQAKFLDNAELAKSYGTSDEDKKKVVGIVSHAKILKSRYAKPFEKIAVQIPWVGGIDKFSGLKDLFMQEGHIISPQAGYFQARLPDAPDGWSPSLQKAKFEKAFYEEYAMKMIKLPVGDASGVEPPKEDVEEADDMASEEESNFDEIAQEDAQ